MSRAPRNRVRMIGRPRTWGRPIEPLSRIRADRQVVDRGEAAAHQAALVELPVLVAVGSGTSCPNRCAIRRRSHGDAVSLPQATAP